MANNVVNIKSNTALTTTALEAAKTIHKSEKAAELAKRIKDRDGYEKAVRDKVEAQAAFAAICQALFLHGGDRKSEEFKRNRIPLDDLTGFCRSFGFHERTVKNWYSLIDLKERERIILQMLKRCWSILEREEPVRASSESSEWYTPPEYIEVAREVLGTIDLDPASNAEANRTIKAKRFFTAENDGLSQKWTGNVFMNPPYGQLDDGSSLAALFCDKAISEYEANNVKAAIVLVNSMHSQRWQAPLYAYPICFVNHRIKFVVGDGTAENKSPTFQNMFVYMGPDRKRFAAVFDRFGYTMEKI